MLQLFYSVVLDRNDLILLSNDLLQLLILGEQVL